MTPTVEPLFQAARALPEGDQIELIDALIAGLDETNPQPLSAAWLATAVKVSGFASDHSRSGTGAPWAEACIWPSASSRRNRGSAESPWRSAVISTRQWSGSGVAVAMAGISSACRAVATRSARSS